MFRADLLQNCLLAQTMTGKARDQLVPAAMQALQPFFDMATRGEHRLARFNELSCACLHKDLEISTGLSIEHFRFVDQPLVLPPERTYFYQVEQYLGIKFIGDIVRFVEATFDNYLWMDLEDIFQRHYQESDWIQVINRFLIDLRLALLSFLCFTILGDWERQRKMGHALDLMHSAIPLGQDPKQDRSWIILAA